MTISHDDIADEAYRKRQTDRVIEHSIELLREGQIELVLSMLLAELERSKKIKRNYD